MIAAAPPRTHGLSTSLIRSFAAAAPASNISLALGEPGWAMPQVARDAISEWARDVGRCAYGPNQGSPQLRAALCERFALADERLMVTAGSQAALFAVFTAHVRSGDQVFVPDPGFPAYRTLTHLAGGVTREYPLASDGSLDAAALIEALDRHPHESGQRVRMLVLNHPSNPTGGGASIEALREVSEVCEDRDIILLSDEVYRELSTSVPQPSAREVSERAIVTESVSKAWAAPGLRVGWASGPLDLLAPATLVHNAMNTAPAMPSQVAATALVLASDEVLAHSAAELRARWDLMEHHAPSWCSGARPVGGFYRWAAPPVGAGDHSSWAAGLRDHGGVSVVPGSAFGPAGSDYVRISVAGPEDELIEGLGRISRYDTSGGTP